MTKISEPGWQESRQDDSPHEENVENMNNVENGTSPAGESGGGRKRAIVGMITFAGIFIFFVLFGFMVLKCNS